MDIYRPNVALIIFNKKGDLLLCKRKKMDSWQFPQGGIDEKESELQAAYRELYEEVGISKNKVELIKKHDEWLKYDIPSISRRTSHSNKKFKGQKQKYFLFKLAKETKIYFDNDPDSEFDDYKWVSYWYPLKIIIDFKKEVYREALNKLKFSYCRSMNNVD